MPRRVDCKQHKHIKQTCDNDNVSNMRTSVIISALAAAVISSSTAQDYDEADYGQYADDNLYQNYAMQHEEQAAGHGGFGLGKVALSSAFTYFLGAKIHSGRVAKKLSKKHKQDQKTLYTQYYNDVYKLEEQKAEQQLIIDQLKKKLADTTEEHEMENLQREYDEFKWALKNYRWIR